MSVDLTAKRFLENYTRMRSESVQPVKPQVLLPGEEIVHDEDTFAPNENVIVQRTTSPRFFAGVTPRSGRAIWSNDPKHAKIVIHHRLHLYEQKLGEALIPSWPL